MPRRSRSGSTKLGNMIRTLRESHGFTQQQLSRAIRSNKDIVGEYERRVRIPTAEKIVAIGKTLNLTESEAKGLRETFGEAVGLMGPMVERQLRIKKVKAAWQTVTFNRECDALIKYYQPTDVPLFQYPAAPGSYESTPLYVRPEWTSLSDADLKLHFVRTIRSHTPSREQREFFDLYPIIRKAVGLGPIWNGRVFALVAMATSGRQLTLRFNQGQFFDSVMCQYLLEHELVQALLLDQTDAPHLPLRDQTARDVSQIEHFCATHTVRVGVSNLILLRKSQDTYVPVIQRRGIQNMATGYDPVSSGIFDIQTGSPQEEFNLKHKVLKEIYEELLQGTDVEHGDIMHVNPKFFYAKDGIADLIALLHSGGATFQVTGFCIDLIRVVPEICTVLVVREQKYFERHYSGSGREFKLNLEYGLPSFIEMPRKIDDVDQYLREGFPSEPGAPNSPVGFSPRRWTLPGAFCFYQGLRRAVENGLL